MDLILRTFKVPGERSFNCWIFQTVDDDDITRKKYWFKARDVATFLGYSKSRNAISRHVKQKWKKTWDELRMGYSDIIIPRNWKPQTVFISEPGVYCLAAHSKLTIADIFNDWIYEKILPSLRHDASLTLINNLQRALQIAVDEKNEIISKITMKPYSEKLHHSLVIHEINDCAFVPRLIFTRCQNRSLVTTLNRIKKNYPKSQERYHYSGIPNGVNVLNSVKEWLAESNIHYTACNNNLWLSYRYDVDALIQFVRSFS